MGQRLSLEQIKIAEPCHESWDAMTGDQHRRFCDSCSKHVHDLSQMSRSEAEALLNSGQSVCVRMLRTASGKVLTKSRFDRSARWFRYAASVAAMLGIGSLFQLGCKTQGQVTKAEATPDRPGLYRTMGIVARPERHPPAEMGKIAPATRPATPQGDSPATE